jgi:hypothetical protein
MVDNRKLAKKHFLSGLMGQQDEAYLSHRAQSTKQAFIGGLAI